MTTATVWINVRESEGTMGSTLSKRMAFLVIPAIGDEIMVAGERVRVTGRVLSATTDIEVGDIHLLTVTRAVNPEYAHEERLPDGWPRALLDDGFRESG